MDDNNIVMETDKTIKINSNVHGKGQVMEPKKQKPVRDYLARAKEIMGHKRGRISNEQIERLAEWVFKFAETVASKSYVLGWDVKFAEYCRRFVIRRGMDFGGMFYERFNRIKKLYHEQSRDEKTKQAKLVSLFGPGIYV
jgi:hypothetical protein